MSTLTTTPLIIYFYYNSFSKFICYVICIGGYSFEILGCTWWVQGNFCWIFVIELDGYLHRTLPVEVEIMESQDSSNTVLSCANIFVLVCCYIKCWSSYCLIIIKSLFKPCMMGKNGVGKNRVRENIRTQLSRKNFGRRKRYTREAKGQQSENIWEPLIYLLHVSV